MPHLTTLRSLDWHTIGRLALGVLFGIALIAVPVTTLQILQRQYIVDLSLERDAKLEGKRMFDERTAIESDYAQRQARSPWRVPADAARLVYFFVPPLNAIALSQYARLRSRGDARQKFLSSMIVAASYIPAFAFCSVPWLLYDNDPYAPLFFPIFLAVFGTGTMVLAAILTGTSALTLWMLRVWPMKETDKEEAA